jgi:serine/threonine-protein kinase HipA
MLRIWADSQHAGFLDRHGNRGGTFAYEPELATARAVSVTMPVRLASWNSTDGLLPIFDMNLPEGVLRARLSASFANSCGSLPSGGFDDIDLLAVVGHAQIGRIRCSAADVELSDDVPFQSIDEIIKAGRGGELSEHLLQKFAVHSGISGVQPKVMVRGVADQSSSVSEPRSYAGRPATHIVKLWEAAELPELAANEYFCLCAAKKAGLVVPSFQLSENGHALVVERFDLKADGSYRGFEDFCVLNGLTSAKKYDGGYETRLFKRASEFIEVEGRRTALERLFRLFVLNCALRNGDAHLKNFGIIYDDVVGPARLAPVYDLVTTDAYIPDDAMALTLNGSTLWPDKRALVVLAQSRCDIATKEIGQILEQTADALCDVMADVKRYFSEAAAHPEIGDRMLNAWETGIAMSLERSDHRMLLLSGAPAGKKPSRKQRRRPKAAPKR